MPQDPNLYGQRPVKRQKKDMPLSSSLTFASQLTSLLSTPSSTSAPAASTSSGRARPSRAKDDLFSVRAKRKQAPASSLASESRDGARIALRDVRGTEEDKQERARTKRKMEEKARLYAAMKRGDYIAKEGEEAPLVDFDAKWAQKHPEGPEGAYSSSGEDNASSDYDDFEDPRAHELVEYQDEFGRTRQGTRAELERQRRKEQRRALGAEELDRMSARPRAPEEVIYGDTIQTQAFNPEDATWDKMEELAAKRDRAPTPPDDTHYDSKHEIRTKGVGFYNFSQDKEGRAREMESLAQERGNTERIRREREVEKEKRKREIEERRRKISEKRAERLANNFLEGLAGEMAATASSAAPGTEEGTKPS